jgi:hypothetical protein
MRRAPSSTTARQRHDACHPKQRTPTTHATPHRTLTCRIQTHKPRTPARRPTQHQPLRTAQLPPHAHRRAHATHSTAHSSDHPTRRPQKITPSHTRRLRATLTAELSGCRASTGCCRRVGWRASPAACRTHEQRSRHTMAPDAAHDPSQPPATHRSESHSINQIKTNESQFSTLHAIAHAQNRVQVTPKTRQPDSPQVPDAVIPLDNAATLRRLRTSQRDTQRRYPRANKRSAHNNSTATANSK